MGIFYKAAPYALKEILVKVHMFLFDGRSQYSRKLNVEYTWTRRAHFRNYKLHEYSVASAIYNLQIIPISKPGLDLTNNYVSRELY